MTGNMYTPYNYSLRWITVGVDHPISFILFMIYAESLNGDRVMIRCWLCQVASA